MNVTQKPNSMALILASVDGVITFTFMAYGVKVYFVYRIAHLLALLEVLFNCFFLSLIVVIIIPQGFELYITAQVDP